MTMMMKGRTEAATAATTMMKTAACASQRPPQEQQCQGEGFSHGDDSSMMECIVETLAGNRARCCISTASSSNGGGGNKLADVLWAAVKTSWQRDYSNYNNNNNSSTTPLVCSQHRQRSLQSAAYLVHEGKVLDEDRLAALLLVQRLQQRPNATTTVYFKLQLRLLGGMDRQNRVGSKFGGGGVSTAQQSERERKDRLKRLALESIDLAKDPYLVRNHVGTLECKLCLTLHRDEANYLAHTQGKKHQAGLAKRAHLEKLQQQREASSSSTTTNTAAAAAAAADASQQHKPKKIRIGRPAYQVFKSREAETNQRCLSFELSFPAIETGLQPRHRFMSAYEQRVETPDPHRRHQYLLFAADPYETVAFKIPNEPIDKGENRFVTHWDAEHKKFILTLYFLEPTSSISSSSADTATATTAVTTAAAAAAAGLNGHD